jgi:uncharacterized phage protein (TIGR02216 family)
MRPHPSRRAQGRAPQDEGLRPFPWDDAIGFGLGVLKLPPDQFWRMTPRELALAAKALNPRGGALGRADLTQLMQKFPDGRLSR